MQSAETFTPPRGLPPQAAAESGLNLRHYLHILIERRWLAITIFLIVQMLVGLYLAKAVPIYSATARIQINRETENPMGNVKEVSTSDAREFDYLQTQYKNLTSRSLIYSVVQELHLEKDARYAKAPDTVTAVSEDVQIIPVRLSRLVDIKVEHSDRKKAAEIANSIANRFIENNLNQKMQASFNAVTWLKSQVDDTRNNIKAADAAVHAYRTNYNEVSLEEGENIIRQGLIQAKSDLTRAGAEAAADQRVIETIDEMIAEGKPMEAFPQVLSNPAVQRIKGDLAIQEANLAALLKRYRDKHPSVIQSRGQIANLRDSLRRESEISIEGLRNQARLSLQRELALKDKVVEEEKNQQRLNLLRIQYDQLKREAENKKLINGNVLSRLSETELMSRLANNNMLVVDPAFPAQRPIKPRFALTILLGMVGGFGVALAMAFFASYLDDSIKSQDDVEGVLRLNFLGYIPNVKSASLIERDLQCQLHPQSNAAEGFRTLRAAIGLAQNSDKMRVITVTSTIPSEGKSLVASNLAIVLAQSGLRTLLVDADLRRPSVHKAYQIHGPRGLTSYLTKAENNFDSLVHKSEETSVPNLDVICCGAVPSTPSELIGSPRMIQFLEEARSKYDRVIVDCPPISAVSDPLVISAKADGIVFVTKFNKIRREHARKSIQRLQNAGIRIIGAVINDIDFEGKDSYYYSYYYYQNRYYS